jgi:hypothetical protein
MIREQHENLNDDVSTITNKVLNQRTRDNATVISRQTTSPKVSVDNARQAMSRQRHIGAFKMIHHTVINRSNQVILSSRQHQYDPTNCRAELDSHADTWYSGKVAEVSGFSPSLKPLSNISIVKAAVAYYNLDTGETTILIINQTLYFNEQLPHLLLNPIKCEFIGRLLMSVLYIYPRENPPILL